ncbi:hypothetical protein [Pantoea agglomerans]|uniref:hypothetical protein n=1 Tax=Enterobacter agglomerans TaxID=549 RepID=UPI0032088DC2
MELTATMQEREVVEHLLHMAAAVAVQEQANPLDSVDMQLAALVAVAVVRVVGMDRLRQMFLLQKAEMVALGLP